MTAKNYGTVSAARQKEMTGLEFVRGLANGELPLNTIARTLGYDVAEAERGRVLVTLVPTGAHLNILRGQCTAASPLRYSTAAWAWPFNRPSTKTLARPPSSSRFPWCVRSRPRLAKSGPREKS